MYPKPAKKTNVAQAITVWVSTDTTQVETEI
jgi:hypothetical protein